MRTWTTILSSLRSPLSRWFLHHYFIDFNLAFFTSIWLVTLSHTFRIPSLSASWTAACSTTRTTTCSATSPASRSITSPSWQKLLISWIILRNWFIGFLEGGTICFHEILKFLNIIGVLHSSKIIFMIIWIFSISDWVLSMLIQIRIS